MLESDGMNQLSAFEQRRRVRRITTSCNENGTLAWAFAKSGDSDAKALAINDRLLKTQPTITFARKRSFMAYLGISIWPSICWIKPMELNPGVGC